MTIRRLIWILIFSMALFAITFLPLYAMTLRQTIFDLDQGVYGGMSRDAQVQVTTKTVFFPASDGLVLSTTYEAQRIGLSRILDVKITPDQTCVLRFQLEMHRLTQDASVDRSAFTILIMTDSLTQALQLGFRDQGYNSFIFAHEVISNDLAIGDERYSWLSHSDLKTYTVTIRDGYYVVDYQVGNRSNVQIAGKLKNYLATGSATFNHPYGLRNVVMMGDYSSSGSAKVKIRYADIDCYKSQAFLPMVER